MAHGTCAPHFFRHCEQHDFDMVDMILKQKENENNTIKIGIMGVCLNYHGHENNQVYKISWFKMRPRVGLIPNPNPKTRKIKTRTRQVQDKNST
jgi:hypothetical protein